MFARQVLHLMEPSPQKGILESKERHSDAQIAVPHGGGDTAVLAMVGDMTVLAMEGETRLC